MSISVSSSIQKIFLNIIIIEANNDTVLIWNSVFERN